MSVRKSEERLSHPSMASLRNSLRNQLAILPTPRPIARAKRSLRSSNPKSTIAETRTRIPMAAASTRAGVTPPSRASRARARTGMPSFTKLFQMPVTTAERPMDPIVNPHELSMATDTPTPITPPPGSVFDLPGMIVVERGNRKSLPFSGSSGPAAKTFRGVSRTCPAPGASPSGRRVAPPPAGRRPSRRPRHS